VLEEEMQDIQAGGASDAGRLFTAATATIPGGTDLLGTFRQRQAAWQRRRRGVLAAGSAAVAAVATAGTLLSVTAATAPSALAAVTAAISKTDSTSYRVNMTVRYSPGVVDRDTGTFDPVRHVGQLTITDTSRPPTQIRYLPGVSYVFDPLNHNAHGKWMKVRIYDVGIHGNPALGQLDAGFDGIVPEDPGSLLALLRSAAEVTDAGSASGPGWTGTKYTFTAVAVGMQLKVTGTVAVDKHGRVRELRVTRDYGPDNPTPTDAISYSDFGVSVHVSAPPANQVANTVPIGLDPVF
jgi:hypothetical protein